MAHLEFTTAQPDVQRRAIHLFYERRGKRMVDLCLAVLLLPVLAPIIALLWIITRCDGQPGLFAHTRIGRNGTPFRCWKIRTMVADAEAHLARHIANNPQAAHEWSRAHKLTDDPRVTRLGRILRRTSLDELPQIWNVLCGDMSLVGPRPVTECELSRYGAHRSIYLNLRPGVTGLWQIKGRSNGCYEERLGMDRSYAATLGLYSDAALILKTALVPFRPTGR
ncbi:MAG: sugar transferase [Aestuariivita sp.]|uniref:sugar transferase n=1 Tax=Aestuariivita sp. TaxID=1872407 RepID=UPI003BAF46CA